MMAEVNIVVSLKAAVIGKRHRWISGVLLMCYFLIWMSEHWCVQHRGCYLSAFSLLREKDERTACVLRQEVCKKRMCASRWEKGWEVWEG